MPLVENVPAEPVIWRIWPPYGALGRVLTVKARTWFEARRLAVLEWASRGDYYDPMSVIEAVRKS